MTNNEIKMNANVINPFGAFTEELEDINENAVISGPIRIAIDLPRARANAELVNFIGRGDKSCFAVLDKEHIGKLKVFSTGNITGNFSNYMLKGMTYIINSFVNKGVGISMLTTSNNAIAVRMYRKHTADMDILDIDEILEKMTAGNSFYHPEVDDTQERVALKHESKVVLRDFIEAMVEADSHGIYIEVNKIDEYNQLILNVPEDVKVKAGDILTFTNGSTADGITVQGWKNFTRAKAEVQQKTVNGRLVYFLYKKNKDRFTKIEQVMHSVIGQMWAKCPATEATVDMDSCEETTFSF